MAGTAVGAVAGRRVRDAIRAILFDGGVISANAIVTVSGLANTYTNYIVTYGTQRFADEQQMSSARGSGQ